MRYDLAEEFEWKIQEFFDPLAHTLTCHPTIIDNSDVFLEIVLRLYNFAMSRKHPGFEEEREIRLVHTRGIGTDHLGGAYYGISGGSRHVKSVLKLPVRDYPEANIPNTSWSHILSEIIIGPSHFADNQRIALEYLLRAKGLDAVPVRCSEIPYRSTK
jgi:hypothetical protein